jgi:hypothetical protein
MNSHNRHATLIRAGLLAAVLTAGGALVAYASLPSAADGGQAHAAAKGGNATQSSGHAQGADENPADGTSTAADKLAANWDRLNATLNDVLARLKAGNASDAAVTALQNVIDRLAGDHGLHTAINAVTDNGGSHLPDVVTNHPGRP